MVSIKNLWLVVLCVAVVALQAGSCDAQEEVRTWTTRDGKSSVQASLVEANEDVVKLRKENGTVVPVPVSKLSKADIDFLIDKKFIVPPKTSTPVPNPAASDSLKQVVSLRAQNSGSGVPALLTGLPFAKEDKTEFIVIPVGAMGLPINDQSYFELCSDATKIEIQQSYSQNRNSQRVLKTAKLDVPPLAVASAGKLKKLKKGTKVNVQMVSTIQATVSGAKPRIEVKTSSHRIAGMTTDDQGKVIGFNLDLEYPSNEAWALVTNDDDEAIGVVLPKSRQLIKRRGANTRGEKLANVVLINKFFNPNRPAIVASSGIYHSKMSDSKSTGHELKLFIFVDRILSHAARLKIQQIKFFSSSSGFSQLSQLSQSPQNGTPIYAAKNLTLTPVNPDDPIASLSKTPTSNLHCYAATISLPLTNLKVRYEVLATLADQNANGAFESAPVRVSVPHLSTLQPSMLAETNFWQDTFKSFRSDHPITGLLTKFDNFEQDTNMPRPKFVGPVDPPVAGIVQKDGSLNFEFAENDNNAIKSPRFCVSSDESVAWTLDLNNQVHRIELNNKQITHRLSYPKDENPRFDRRTFDFALTKNGLLLAIKGGLVLLDKDTLEPKDWFPGVAANQLVANADSRFAFGFGESYFWVVDTELGVPVHRIKNQFISARDAGNFGFVTNGMNFNSIRGLAISPDGQHLFCRLPNCFCRLRIEGSELIFEERSPMYLGKGNFGVWISGDGKLISPGNGGLAPKFLERNFGKGNLEFLVGGKAHDIFNPADLSKPIRSVMLKEEMGESRERIIFDGRQQKFWDGLAKTSFSENPASLLPKSNRVLASGFRRSDKKYVLSLISIGSDGGDPLSKSAQPTPNPAATKISFAGKSWNEAAFQITELNFAGSPTTQDARLQGEDYSNELEEILKSPDKKRLKKLQALNGVSANKRRKPMVVPQLIWADRGKHVFAAYPDGVIRKVQTETWDATLEINLGCSIYTPHRNIPDQKPFTFIESFLGLVVASQATEKIVILDPATLDVIEMVDFPLIKSVVGSSQHHYLVCALSNGTGVLYDLKNKKVQQVLREASNSSIGVNEYRSNSVSIDTGMISPFTTDGKFIYSNEYRFELVDGKLIKNENVVLNQRNAASGGSVWSFKTSGYAYHRVGNGPWKTYRIDNLEDSIFRTEREILVRGVEPQSKLLVTTGGGVKLYASTGELKYELSSVSGLPVVPPACEEGFLIFETNAPFLPAPSVLWVKYHPRK